MLIFAHIRDNFAAAFFPRWSEWNCAIVIFLLGLMLSSNPALMATGTGKGYSLMLSIADQIIWAKVFMAFGIFRLLILLINGAWRRSPHLRAATAVFCCFFWTQIALSFAPIFGFAFILASGYLINDLINIHRAMRDARTVDDAYAKEKRGNAS